MGVVGLLASLKQVASERVDLNDGAGTIIYDGHASMHRSAGKDHVAVPLLLNNDVRELVLDMLVEMMRFEEAGWKIVVIFDGASPPSKACTSEARARERYRKLEACRALQEQLPVDCRELGRLAKSAVEFTAPMVAKVSQMLMHSLRAECITAPFEADPQLKVMEDLCSTPGRRCFVRANDADLAVLGVRSLLWGVGVDAGGLWGDCIQQTHILHPRTGAFEMSSKPFAFLRKLHGVDPGDSLATWSNSEDEVMTRLRNHACVAGNDYTKFAGIGPAHALDIATPHGPPISPEQIATNLAAFSPAFQEDAVLAQLKTSMDMFCHPVVWDPATGAHRHLSGVETSNAITRNTGTLASRELAGQIAGQAICPTTREPWRDSVAVSTEGLPPRLSAPGGGLRVPSSSGGGGRGGRGGGEGRASSSSGRGGRVGRIGQGRKRAAPLGGAEGNNYDRSGNWKLPGADMDFSSWTVEALREFLSAFRCLEMSGMSGFRKAQLVALAKACCEVVREAGLEGSCIAFRHPVRSTPQPPQPGAFPPPGSEWLEWEALRPTLPEISDNIIIGWLKDKGSLKGSTGRVLYRGLQRVLDFGALRQLSGRPCGVDGGLMWLQFEARGSMRPLEYEVSAALEVERVLEVDNTGGSEGGQAVDTARYVATQVVHASCGCHSGAGAGCHHVCQLLQLTRLLQLTEVELSQWNPLSPTSVACKWILDHCGAGRDKNLNVLHRLPLGKIAQSMRTLRDPNKHPFEGCAEDFVETRGVVAMNRADEYNPHPGVGKWTERQSKFAEGATFTQAQQAKFASFLDKGRKQVTRKTAEGDPLPSEMSSLCIDVNKTKTR